MRNNGREMILRRFFIIVPFAMRLLAVDARMQMHGNVRQSCKRRTDVIIVFLKFMV